MCDPSQPYGEVREVASPPVTGDRSWTIRRTAPAIAAVVAAVLLGSPLHGRAEAQVPPPTSRSALSVSPGIVDSALDPGTTFTIDISLANQSPRPVTIRASAGPLVPEQEVDEAYRAAFDDSAWFTVNNPNFNLLAQERKKVGVTVTVPPDAEPGGHYATINFDSFHSEQTAADPLAVNARVGVVVLLSVTGDVRERASFVGPIRVDTFDTDTHPTEFALTLRNEGNVHVLPQGKLVVRNVFGRVVEELPLPPGTLLPGTDREYPVTWKHGLIAGIYTVEAEIIAGSQGFELDGETKRFVVAPLTVVVPVLFLILLGSGLVFIHRRDTRRRRRPPAVSVSTKP